MRWCDIHFQWGIWLENKLIATLWGGADDRDKSLMYQRVIDVILDPTLTFIDGIPHES